MTVALLTALVAVNIAYLVLFDRKDKRHARHVERLLHYRHDPATAVLADLSPAELLYIPPEDDKAWNEHHGTGDQ